MLRLAHRRAGGGSRAGGDTGGHLRLQVATFVEARVKWVRDRALDHAVEKEKNLRPVLALKTLILAEPSKSIPVADAAERKLQLGLPTRAVDFVRRNRSVFVEFPSPADHRRPHVRLTPEALELHEEEKSVYESCRSESADRLLKLLMLAPARRLPLELIDLVRWDMGLPDDYVRTILPDYPDYFELTTDPSTQKLWVELVCYNKELAVSAMERRAAADSDGGYKRGGPLAFPMEFSRGFDLEKKVKKWVDEWQKLPYVSPYEDGWSLDPKTDIGEKWAVGMMHELLCLFAGKKAEKDTLLAVGAHLGLRPGFKRAFIQYPGIFYLSNKIRTHTIVLRDAYKRDLLVEKHPLMSVRYQWIHLMHKQAAPLKSTTNSAPSSKDGAAAGKSKNSATTPMDAGVVEDVGDGEDEDEDEDEEEEEEEEEEDEDEDEDEDGEICHTSDEQNDDEDVEEQSGMLPRNSHGGRRDMRRNSDAGRREIMSNDVSRRRSGDVDRREMRRISDVGKREMRGSGVGRRERSSDADGRQMSSDVGQRGRDRGDLGKWEMRNNRNVGRRERYDDVGGTQMSSSDIGRRDIRSTDFGRRERNNGDGGIKEMRKNSEVGRSERYGDVDRREMRRSGDVDRRERYGDVNRKEMGKNGDVGRRERYGHAGRREMKNSDVGRREMRGSDDIGRRESSSTNVGWKEMRKSSDLSRRDRVSDGGRREMRSSDVGRNEKRRNVHPGGGDERFRKTVSQGAL